LALKAILCRDNRGSIEFPGQIGAGKRRDRGLATDVLQVGRVFI